MWNDCELLKNYIIHITYYRNYNQSEIHPKYCFTQQYRLSPQVYVRCLSFMQDTIIICGSIDCFGCESFEMVCQKTFLWQFLPNPQFMNFKCGFNHTKLALFFGEAIQLNGIQYLQTVNVDSSISKVSTNNLSKPKRPMETSKFDHVSGNKSSALESFVPSLRRVSSFKQSVKKLFIQPEF